MKTIESMLLLQSMTRQELGSVAKALNLPVGKSKTDTIGNLLGAIDTGKAQVKFIGSIIAPPDTIRPGRRLLFMKKLRTYKADKVLTTVTPDLSPDS